MPTYLSGDTDADDAEPKDAEPEDSNVRYDLAGNPLPGAIRPAPAPSIDPDEPPPLPRPVPPSPAFARPSAAPPPRPDFGAPAVWTPPPGYTSPPGFNSAPPPKALVSSISGTPLYAVLGVVVVGIVALTFALHHLKPNLVPAPAAYKTYTALDGSFVCDQPVGWKTKEAGEAGGTRAMVTFESGKVVVEVESDASKLLTANSAITNPYAATPFAKIMPLVEQMHEKDVQQWMNALPNFKEKPAEPYTSKFGEARVSEWTASQGNVKLRGYRATMASKDRQVSIFCLTPDRNWKILEPAFQHIITSVGPGSQ